MAANLQRIWQRADVVAVMDEAAAIASRASVMEDLRVPMFNAAFQLLSQATLTQAGPIAVDLGALQRLQ